MFLASWLRVFPTARRIEACGTEIAQRAQADVAARLSPSVRSMSMSAARGYIQARAASVLDREMQSIAEQSTANPAIQVAVRREATAEIVRMTLADLVKSARQQAGRKAA